METDADRLASIMGLGGQLIFSSHGSFFGIFDREFILVAGGVESRTPAINARTSDVSDIPKDTEFHVGSERYRLKRHEPDGTGMTVLILKT